MAKVTRYSNWCDIDQLDGKDLVSGEELMITWPDGTKEKKKVRVESSSYRTNDMGHPYDVPVKKAYVIITYKGVHTQISIVGLEAKRV